VWVSGAAESATGKEARFKKTERGKFAANP
jgi:hypothetical protein